MVVRASSSSQFDELPGARESNAGDEFHMLWGVWRCLSMIRPDSSLRSVIIEDVSPVDKVNTSQRAFLAADITEYYDGESFDEATSVILSQLKYSFRNADQRWTAGRLAPKGPPVKKTTLGKLARAYLEYKQNFGRSAVQDKLTISLTSNRPGDPNLLRMVSQCKSLLSERPDPTPSQALLNSLDGSMRGQYDLLLQRSGLDERDFSDFLRVLDLNHLGESDRYSQEHRIVLTLSEHVLGDVFGAVRILYDLVRKRALPEASGSRGITRAEILTRLGVHDRTDLFPLPSRVEMPRVLVENPDAGRLAATLASGGVRRVVAHGDAGVGKTTSLLQLQDAMPENSVVVVYDCFAGGEYLSPTEPRHLPRHALRQLINEIALACGTPLLLTSDVDDFELWNRLKRVLWSAGSSLESTGGHLVLAIDAADNAVVAARERQDEDCFVPDLWRLTLPDNVYLVMTCRTARLNHIPAREDLHKLELQGFDGRASATHFQSYFPTATADECSRFHTNSRGNPRVQSYVLDRERSGATSEVQECIDQALKTPAQLFEDLLQTASDSRSDAGDAVHWPPILMALERPIRIDSVARALEVELVDVYLYCRALIPGVRIEDETVTFRDEDFEAYVRSRYRDSARVHACGRIAECYWELRHSHDWAAKAIAGHLFNAGQADQLIALTVDEREPVAIRDPLARNQAFVSRIGLGLRATALVDNAASLKLIALAIEMKHTDSAVGQLIRESPELAMKYADPVAVARVYEPVNEESWKGPLHMRVAASSARRGDLTTARKQYELANAWLRQRADLDERDLADWSLDADDAAALAEAAFYLGRADAIAAIVTSWRPSRFGLEAGDHLMDRLARGPRRAELAGYLEEQQLTPEVEARFLGILYRNGISVSPSRPEHLCLELIANPPGHESVANFNWFADFAENAASAVDSAVLLDLIQVLGPPVPNWPPEIGMGDWDTFLRFALLEAVVTNSDFDPEAAIPHRLREPNDPGAEREQSHRTRQEREKHVKLLTSVAEQYRLRASSALGKLDTDEIVARAVQGLERFVDGPTYHEPRAWWRRFDCTVEAIFDSISLTDADPRAPCEMLRRITVGDQRPLRSWLTAAERVIRHGSHITAALHLIDGVVHESQARDAPAGEKAARLVESAALVDHLDGALAHDYYSAAIEELSGMDEERSRALFLIDHLASRLVDADLSSERSETEGLPRRLRDAVEHFRPYVYEPDSLPWQEILGTVTALNPAEGLRTLTLWDEAGYLHLDRGIGTVAATLARRDIVTVPEAIELLWLSHESTGCAGTALAILEAGQQRGSSRKDLVEAGIWMSERITRHLTFGARVADAVTFSKWIESNGFHNDRWAEDILALARVASPHSSTSISPTQRHLDEDESEDRRQERIKHILRSAISDRVRDLESRLDELAANWARSADVGDYLRLFGAHISPTSRLAAAEVLLSTDPESRVGRLHSDTIAQILTEWHDAWSNTYSIRTWFQQNLPRFFLERLPRLVGFDYRTPPKSAAYLCGSAVDDPIGLVLDATSRHLETLDLEQLVVIGKVLADALPQQACVEGLHWILNDLLGNPHSAPRVPQEPSNEALLPRLTWSLLGHPDKFVRWRAAHYLVDRSRVSPPIIDRLMQHFDDRSGLGHVAPTSTFLWMSAQVWALLALRRLAIDDPATINLVIPRLRRIAADTDWPHALLREVARLTVLEWANTSPSSGDNADEGLQLANRPHACSIDRVREWQRAAREREGMRFSFDSMDTVPYWFASAARIFALPTDEFEIRAEHWIVDELGFNDEIVCESAGFFRRRFGYVHSDNRHGSQPRVENLQRYLEWHSMFLVAGELADSGAPVVIPEDDPIEDPWIVWLGEYVKPDGARFGSDRRDPVPLVSKVYGHEPTVEGWRDVATGDFDGEVLREDSVVVRAAVKTCYGPLDESVSVYSALVSPESAGSLVKSLQNSPDHHCYVFPTEGTSSGREIDLAGFRLIGWLAESEWCSTGLEEYDPIRRIDSEPISPGPAFDQYLCERGRSPGVSPEKATLTNPVKIRNWSDVPRKWSEYSRPRYAEGQEVLVQVGDLLAFLDSAEMDLVLEVIISRNFEWRRGEVRRDREEELYDRGTARIYLLRRDGSLVDGMGRYIRIGESDCHSTQDR